MAVGSVHGAIWAAIGTSNASETDLWNIFFSICPFYLRIICAHGMGHGALTFFKRKEYSIEFGPCNHFYTRVFSLNTIARANGICNVAPSGLRFYCFYALYHGVYEGEERAELYLSREKDWDYPCHQSLEPAACFAMIFYTGLMCGKRSPRAIQLLGLPGHITTVCFLPHFTRRATDGCIAGMSWGLFATFHYAVKLTLASFYEYTIPFGHSVRFPIREPKSRPSKDRDCFILASIDPNLL